MRLGVETPDAARRRHARCPTTDRGDRGRRPAHRRRRAQQRPRRRPARARALPGARARRCWPARPASCATSRRPAATCCSAPAARTSRTSTKPCNKREPGLGLPGARRRPPQPRDPRRTREHCVATHPSDMAVALAALDAIVHVDGPRRRARASPIADLHRLPGDEPERDTVLEHGELITAVELPPLPSPRSSRYRKVRDRASFAFALVSVAAALDVADGAVARRAHRARRRRPQAVARVRAEDALRGAARRPRRRSAPAADAELAQARAAARQRLQGPARAQRCSSARSRDLRGGAMTATRPDRRARSTGSRAARRSPGEATYAVRAPGRGRRLRGRSCSRPSPAGEVTRGRRRRGARTARRARGPHARERAAARRRGRRRARGPAVAARSPTAARSSAVVVAESLEVAREAAGSCGSSTPRERARRRAAPPTTPALRARTRSTPAPDRHRATATSRRRSRGAPVTVDATYTTPAQHNNPMEPHATLALWDGDGG